jgi:HEAT repeat protein
VQIDARVLRRQLEHGEVVASAVVHELADAALQAPTRATRLDACHLLGDLAGRALGAEWDTAETAAFALLECARVADTAADRRGTLEAMGRGFRNIWLLPFVHRRISDRDLTIAAAALGAAGGLGFAALEQAVAALLTEGAPPALRRVAIGALGRMGATSAAARLVEVVTTHAEPHDAAAALTALTEIRSASGRDAARAVIDAGLEPELHLAAVRYLAELGDLDVLPALRRLARAADAEVRIAAGLASRALKAERDRDPAERFLVALGEPDRAVRAQLARRLRTLPVTDVLEQAELLLSEDAAGVVQVLGEVREPEVTRYLIQLADRPEMPEALRARAIGSIEADQAWERDALVQLARRGDLASPLRAAAVQAIGAFVTRAELLDRVGELARADDATLRGALLWALQVAQAGERETSAGAATLVAPMLDDTDAVVRRRALYVAGNIGLASLAPVIARRASTPDAVERIAAYVALGELGMPAVISDVVAAIRKEEDPRVLGAASNALISAAPDPKTLAPLVGRATQLLSAPDVRAREAGAELAGLLAGAVPSDRLAKLLADPAAAVRAAAAWALGRIADPSSERVLLGAFADDDPAVPERAAAGLLRLGTPEALAQAILFCAGTADAAARAVVASAIHVSPAHAAQLSPVIDAALTKVQPDDPVFDALVRMKLAVGAAHAGDAPNVDIDAEIVAGGFASFAQLVKLAGFDMLVRSMRSAESLFHATGATPDGDLSPPITLWMKALENYVHAWLGPRLAGLQREPSGLFDYVDRVIGGNWPGFSRWIEPRWRDPAELGGAKVDVPLRAIPNAVRELQEHRRKRLDSPLSITEWARLLVMFAVDHPQTGFRNMLKLGATSRPSSETTIALAHRLHTLAAVRNLVTHRASAGANTLAAFRRAYYAAFEDIVALA